MANAPDGKDTNAATLSSDQVYIKKGDGTEENLAFTNNRQLLSLKKDEYVDISCLPIGWTYTVTETEPGIKFQGFVQHKWGNGDRWSGSIIYDGNYRK